MFSSVNTSNASGETSLRAPSRKNASHTTAVPLYSGRPTIVRVFTSVPLSLRNELGTMSGGGLLLPTKDPLTNQSMKSAVGWRHLKTASSPTDTTCDEGIMLKTCAGNQRHGAK